jgi:hypothetical protein
MASCGPFRRSRVFEMLDVAAQHLRFQKPCGLDLNRNLPFIRKPAPGSFEYMGILRLPLTTNC